MIGNPWWRSAPISKIVVVLLVALVQLALVTEQFLLGQHFGVTIYIGVFPLLLLLALTLLLGQNSRYQELLSLLALSLMASLMLGLYFLDAIAVYSLVGCMFLFFLALNSQNARKLAVLTAVMLLALGFYRYEWQQALADFSIYFSCLLAITYLLFHQKTGDVLADRLSLLDRYSRAYRADYFQVQLEQELERSLREGADCSLIAISLEYGQLADIYGPDAVHRFLPDLVRELRAEIRLGDEVFRINKDVFVLVLPVCSEDNAGLLMERLKRSLSKRQWDHIHDLDITVATTSNRTGDSRDSMQERLMKRLSRQRRVSLDASSF